MSNVAVRAHNVNSQLAIEVTPPAATMAGSLATAQAAWPEHASWLQAAFERGDCWRSAEGADWFFEGDAGEELAGL